MSEGDARSTPRAVICACGRALGVATQRELFVGLVVFTSRTPLRCAACHRTRTWYPAEDVRSGRGRVLVAER
jgi:hypothetical protein